MMMLSQVADATNGDLIGADVLISEVSKDTRSISNGALYVALKGDNFDGHAFVSAASDAGAVAVLVSEEQVSDLPQVKVDDTRLALGRLAASWREKFQGSVIGITGSNGKTTVKEMCRSILANRFGDQKVLSTQGNLNNDIGLPMTLLNLRECHEFAVIEMGANHMGEIDYLTKITTPDIAVITNAGAAHLEGFGSVENVAHAKSEIYNGLTSQGFAVINADDDYFDYWKSKNENRQVVTFSALTTNADIVARDISGSTFLLKTAQGDVSITLQVPGHHNVMNALAATAATLAVGVAVEDIAVALEAYTGVKGRLQLLQSEKGSKLIDDTYNANPYSLKAAMDVLVSAGGEPWLVLGDMGELGEEADDLHGEAGVSAKKMGIKRLFATGEYSRKAVDGFGAGAEFFADKNALASRVYEEMDKKVVVLVKGSRSMKMEEVVAVLMGETESKISQTKSNKVNN